MQIREFHNPMELLIVFNQLNNIQQQRESCHLIWNIDVIHYILYNFTKLCRRVSFCLRGCHRTLFSLANQNRTQHNRIKAQKCTQSSLLQRNSREKKMMFNAMLKFVHIISSHHHQKNRIIGCKSEAATTTAATQHNHAHRVEVKIVTV